MLAKTESKIASATSPSLDRIISVPAWCEEAGISTATGWRMVANGTSPTITRLSPRRVGIRYRHYLEWLESRRTRDADT
jgi:predicted DNA-binding transcriptional regulator AlpA